MRNMSRIARYENIAEAQNDCFGLRKFLLFSFCYAFCCQARVV